MELVWQPCRPVFILPDNLPGLSTQPLVIKWLKSGTDSIRLLYSAMLRDK